MINAKKLYKNIFSDERITSVIPEENILNAYPDEVEIFPCIIYLDENQSDGEYSDNKSGASGCSLTVHIFSKKITGYVSTADVAVVIANVLNEKLWNCSQNREFGDPDPDTEHRVMMFNKSIFELNINS